MMVLHLVVVAQKATINWSTTTIENIRLEKLFEPGYQLKQLTECTGKYVFIFEKTMSNTFRIKSISSLFFCRFDFRIIPFIDTLYITTSWKRSYCPNFTFICSNLSCAMINQFNIYLRISPFKHGYRSNIDCHYITYIVFSKLLVF